MDVAEAVDGWVLGFVVELAANGFAQIDLDDLLGCEPPSGSRVGFECLQRIMTVLPEASDLDGLLTLPLDYSERLDDEVPASTTFFSMTGHMDLGDRFPACTCCTRCTGVALR